MADYSLLPNENVILENYNVCHFERGKTSNVGELVLTNLNLIFVKKGTFGRLQGIQKFPLSKIKTVEGNAQILFKKSSSGHYQIELFFLNSQEIFVFNSLGKKDVIEWLDEISEIITGHPAPLTSSERIYIPGSDVVADTLKNTFNTIKGSFGIKDKDPEKITKRCISCRAPLTGNIGQTVYCKYCDTEQSL